MVSSTPSAPLATALRLGGAAATTGVCAIRSTAATAAANEQIIGKETERKIDAGNVRKTRANDIRPAGSINENVGLRMR